MLKQKQEQKASGFTMIELMIVLVIAGLIIFIVFLAVPNAQRSARNNARHKDASAVLASVLEYKNQNKGRLPDSCNNTSADCFVRQVGMAYYKNQDATPVVIYTKLDHAYTDGDAVFHASDSDAADKVALYNYAVCDDSGASPTGLYASPQSVVVVYALETFNGVASQCKGV